MYTLFFFDGKQIEVFKIEVHGEIYFNPYDLGHYLGVSESDVRVALSKMTSEQVVKFTNSDVDASVIRELDQTGELFLTEAGLFKFVVKLTSEHNAKRAERLTNWLTMELIPAFRAVTVNVLGYVDEKLNELTGTVANLSETIMTATQIIHEQQNQIERLFDILEKAGVKK